MPPSLLRRSTVRPDEQRGELKRSSSLPPASERGSSDREQPQSSSTATTT
eukprot:CAMPEP_0172314188 /NCGR_PEP_ID=MMETSP1058-20130122/21919_1 /TAXON_ID=83371 /ORGANISM="Detonula confervacea, Strain CCMP 353" /LENGTH=49 /DNA_ID= /DNA_START= /DNA_END= /DNA_ORIENTATION=